MKFITRDMLFQEHVIISLIVSFFNMMLIWFQQDDLSKICIDSNSCNRNHNRYRQIVLAIYLQHINTGTIFAILFRKYSILLINSLKLLTF